MENAPVAGTRPRERRRRLITGAIAALGLVTLSAGFLTVGATSAGAATSYPDTFLSTASTTWKYSDNNTDPAAGNSDRLVWTKAGFADTSWKSAKGSFGVKNGGTNIGAGLTIGTRLNQYINGTAFPDVKTFHFRSSFDLTAEQLAGVDGLRATMTYDDAVQVFVNGTKVAGYADARVEAAVEAERNLVYAGTGGGDPVSSSFTIPATALQAGTNTIAIALYQDRESSSDAYLDVKTLTPVLKPTGGPVLSDIILGVAGDETQRNLAWYSSTDTTQVAQIGLASGVVAGAFPASSRTVTATGGPTTSGEFNRFATFTDLQENTSYVYRVGSEGNWSSMYSFRTQEFEGDFNFLFYGDPQIGSSGNIPNDTAGWADTLDVSTTAYPDAELLFSAGDQVETAGNESHYTAFLQPDELRQIPFVATNGNHDVGSKAYEQHFNTPNTDRTAGPGSSSGSGGDYWFIHKGVLFLDINSNSRDYTSHTRWIRDVVAEHGDEAKWKVIAFHHSIYSGGPHATDGDVEDRRNVLPTLFSELGFDLVLQGHDHSYARSYLLRNGEKANADEAAGADTVTAGPGGVLYVTANSASGSKYYDLQSQGFWWLSVANQERVRNYSAIDITDEEITVTTLRSQANGTDKPVNSVVDKVTLNRAETPDVDTQQLQVTVPQAAAGEFIWAVDGTNGLVDLGTAVESGDHYSAEGSINPIRVTDTRLNGPQWSISAQVSDFTSGDESFSGKYLGWTPSVVEAGGDAVAGDKVESGFVSGDGLSASSTLGSAATGHTRGSAKLGAGLELDIPVEVTDGTYQATLTLTALS
ncbi:FN3 domain-containing metallophosphoesterase family protein [Compostimonas suwonensis]|uniref:3',5'-cyclic AMP phosphodiesterase CpdA n=1 Tax=Compostimonas suwonensis TaxID=1048394 RepID=A0A2M9BV18_9MICO|nr:FN3 domain-containing metallophosphoesterase family protein [Compostimonas suwonensis]PJJ61797.1 3',5'-cyclic AMP phosphodiesterase CpdA [Compostimonas suwonensis]